VLKNALSRLLDLRNVLLLAGTVFQVAWYAILLVYMFAHLERLKIVDYSVMYMGGYIVRYESPARLYDLGLQRHIQELILSPAHATNFYPYNHPPFLAHILGWVMTKDFIASYFRWVLVLFVFHLAGLSVLVCLLRLSQWHVEELWIFGISGLLFYPIFVSYLKGQDSTFLLLGVSLWTFGLLTARERVAGLGLALAAIRPQVALMLAIPFLFKRQGVWWWFVVWILILVGYSYLLVGLQGLEGFVQVLLFSGQGTGFDVEYMITLMGVLLRLFPNIDPILFNIIGYGSYALAILFLCLLWVRSRALEFKHIGLAILFSMVFSPHMHSHDLSLLLIPTLCAATTLASCKVLTQKNAALLPLCVSVLLALNDIPSSKIVVYLLMLALALLLWLPDWFRLRKKEPQAC